MTLAIFGASGLVGRSLREFCSNHSIHWIGTYKKSSFPNGIFFDKSDTDSILSFLLEHSITHCINCVAERNVDLCEKEQASAFETNCLFATNLAEICYSKGIYMLHISTDYVFDGQHPPYLPSSPTSPIQEYGKAKEQAEKNILDKHKEAAIVRVPVLYTDKYKNILETAITMIGKKVMDKTQLHKEDNYFIRRPVFIKELAFFIIDTLLSKKTGIYHFYNPFDKVTKYEIAQRISNVLGIDSSHIEPQNNPISQAGRPYDTQLIDPQYERMNHLYTSLNEGILSCFKKFRHPSLKKTAKPTESVLFLIDLDGTLVDTDRLHYDCYKEAFESHGHQFLTWNEYECLSSLEQYCKKTLGEQYQSVKDKKNQLFMSTETICFTPGGDIFLEWLLDNEQNFVVVTNTSNNTVRFLQTKLPLLQRVTQWITRDDVVNPKPDTEPYTVAKDRFGKGEDYCIGIENTECGYLSLRSVTPHIYIFCEPNSHVHKQLYKNDVYYINNWNNIFNEALELHTMNYYFFGEFGYLNQIVLAYIQRYIDVNPLMEGRICIYTYEGYDYILEKLFPGFFRYITIPLQGSRGQYYSSIDSAYPQAQHISCMFSELFPKSLHDVNYKGDLSKFYLRSPIPKPELPHLDSLLQDFTKIVVIFFRKRGVDPERNYEEKDDKWNTLMKEHVLSPNTLVCIYAVSKEECQLPSYIDTMAKNMYMILSMEEATYFFHKCDVAYMNDTGLADFAKNCAVKKIIFRTSDTHRMFIGNAYYNPFNTEIEFADKEVIFFH